MTANCEHLAFSSECTVTRLTEGDDGPVTGFRLDVQVTCDGCGERFVFLGLAGASTERPLSSADGLTLRAPIVPEATGQSFFARIAQAVGTRSVGEA
jgi:hypothetical protein